MDDLKTLLCLADAYGRATNLAEGTVSARVLHRGNRLRELREGSSDIGCLTLRAAIQWFSDNWPAGTDWPYGIARPAPSTAEVQT